MLSGSIALDDAYNNGGTITVDAYDVVLNLNDSTNDYGQLIDNTTNATIDTAFEVTTTGGASSVFTTALDLSDAGIVNAFDIGTNNIVTSASTISSTELDLLDGGITLDELTDSGTLTATLVDINGGAIDGTAIGASTPSSGAFTTLSSTGITAIGNGTATVAIDSSDWDISTTGALTGISFDANGAGNSISNIDNADLTNSAVTVSAGTGLTGGGLVALGAAITLNSVLGESIENAELAADTIDFTAIADSLTLDAETTIAAASALNLLIGNNVTLTTTGTGSIEASSVAADSVALGTDTTGDYVESLAQGTGITISGASGEGSTPTITATLGTSIANSEIDADTIDFDRIADGLTLDATTTIDLDTNTADFIIDNGTFFVDNAGSVGIGTTAPSATLDVAGTFALGDGSGTGSINTSDWDISTTGVLTGISIDANGAGNSITNIDNADLTNSDVTVNAGTGLTGGGLVSLGGAITLNSVLGDSIANSELDNSSVTVTAGYWTLRGWRGCLG